MSDYIRREDATKVICEWGVRQERIGRYAVTIHELKQNTADMLDELPAADVVPVVHGKWMKEDRGHVEYCAVCDQCGFDWMWSDMGYFKFCPNCGAKMDGERKE